MLGETKTGEGKNRGWKKEKGFWGLGVGCWVLGISYNCYLAILVLSQIATSPVLIGKDASLSLFISVRSVCSFGFAICMLFRICNPKTRNIGIFNPPTGRATGLKILRIFTFG